MRLGSAINVAPPPPPPSPSLLPSLLPSLPTPTSPHSHPNPDPRPRFLFTGVQTKGDLNYLGRDFKCLATTKRARVADLGAMARDRGVGKSARFSLERLVALTLHRQLDKSVGVRCSSWEAAKLSQAQERYAAMDVLEGLKVYRHLHTLTDRSARLSAAQALPGVAVDIVPRTGNIAQLSGRCASARVVELDGGHWVHGQPGLTPARVKASDGKRLVEIVEVFAPSLHIPNLKVSGAVRCGTVRYGALRCGTVRCATVWYGNFDSNGFNSRFTTPPRR